MFIGHSQSQELQVQHMVLSAFDPSWMIRRSRWFIVAYMLIVFDAMLLGPVALYKISSRIRLFLREAIVRSD
jgi:hypothetical protein